MAREQRDELTRVHAHYASPNQDLERVQMQLQQTLIQCDHLKREKDAAWQQVEISKDAERQLQVCYCHI